MSINTGIIRQLVQGFPCSSWPQTTHWVLSVPRKPKQLFIRNPFTNAPMNQLVCNWIKTTITNMYLSLKTGQRLTCIFNQMFHGIPEKSTRRSRQKPSQVNWSSTVFWGECRQHLFKWEWPTGAYLLPFIIDPSATQLFFNRLRKASVLPPYLALGFCPAPGREWSGSSCEAIAAKAAYYGPCIQAMLLHENLLMDIFQRSLTQQRDRLALGHTSVLNTLSSILELGCNLDISAALLRTHANTQPDPASQRHDCQMSASRTAPRSSRLCDLAHPGRVCDLGRPRASRSPVCIAVASPTAMRAKSGLGGEPAQSTLPFSPLFQPLLRPFHFPSPLPFLPLAPLSPCKDHGPLMARRPSPRAWNVSSIWGPSYRGGHRRVFQWMQLHMTRLFVLV